MIQSADHARVYRIQELSKNKIHKSCYAQADHVSDYQMLFDHGMDEHSRHDIDPTCKYNAIESVKNEDDVKAGKTTIHASNNNAAEVYEEKSAESHSLLPLLKLSYCSAHTVEIKRSTILDVPAKAMKTLAHLWRNF